VREVTAGPERQKTHGNEKNQKTGSWVVDRNGLACHPDVERKGSSRCLQEVPKTNRHPMAKTHLLQVFGENLTKIIRKRGTCFSLNEADVPVLKPNIRVTLGGEVRLNLKTWAPPATRSILTEKTGVARARRSLQTGCFAKKNAAC